MLPVSVQADAQPVPPVYELDWKSSLDQGIHNLVNFAYGISVCQFHSQRDKVSTIAGELIDPGKN